MSPHVSGQQPHGVSVATLTTPRLDRKVVPVKEKRSLIMAKLITPGITIVGWTVTGTSGDDTIYALTGNDTIYGLGGNDTIYGGTGGGGNYIDGGAGDDIITAYDGNDVLVGGDGNDYLQGGAGADSLYGGAGVDSADYYSSTAGVYVDLSTGYGYYGDAAETFPVGIIAPEAQRLLVVTRESLLRAVDQVRPGRRVSDIGFAVQTHVEAHGFLAEALDRIVQGMAEAPEMVAGPGPPMTLSAFLVMREKRKSVEMSLDAAR